MGLTSIILTSLGLGLVAAALYFYNTYTATNELQVKTSHGWIEGGYTTTRGGRKVMQFLGIPYAKAPVKELSFKPPVEPSIWQGVRKAITECSMCMQQFVLVSNLKNRVVGEEDCLCINVYTPKASTSSKLPVIFFIHGGAYMGLSPAKSFYGPEMMLDKDVVLVTASYRLGVLGFLTTEDSVIPGNWAMKDQAAALRWTKTNIHKFGGDPNSITLMGQDTGAGSVHLHMLSPLTKDLFHRGVIQSGSGLCLWGFSEPGVLKSRSKKVAELIGCPFEPSDKFLECLQKTDSQKIVNTTKTFMVWDADPYAMWNPVVEKPNVKGAFLVQNPYTLTSSKPLLAGYNYGEGIMKTSSLIAGDTKVINAKFKRWNAEFDKITPISLLYDTKSPNPAEITKRVKEFYLKSDKKGTMWPHRETDLVLEGAVWPWVKQLYIPQLNKMFGDFWFTNGLLDAVEKHSGPKYLYHFNYNTSFSMCSNIYGVDYYGGACHSDELMYFFPMNIKYNIFDNPESRDSKLSLKLVELWTNFAKNSVPTASEITWEPIKSTAMEHLKITNKGFSMKTHPIRDRRDFWKSLKLTKN